MKIWLLEPIEDLPWGDNPWDPWYDKSFGFIVRAPSEDVARQYAHLQAGEENNKMFLESVVSKTDTPWLDPSYSTCEELIEKGMPGVIMRNFNSTG